MTSPELILDQFSRQQKYGFIRQTELLFNFVECRRLREILSAIKLRIFMSSGKSAIVDGCKTWKVIEKNCKAPVLFQMNVETCTRSSCGANQTAELEVEWTYNEGGFLCQRKTIWEFEPPGTT
jgi:hypothetical protein